MVTAPNDERLYYRTSEGFIKPRISKHNTSFNHCQYKHETTLSTYMMMIATSMQKKAVSKTQLLSNLLFLSLTNMCPQMTLKTSVCFKRFVAEVTDIRSTLYRVNRVMLWYLIFMDLHVSFETSC